MKPDPISTGKREDADPIDAGLLQAAREAGVDVPRAIETALRRATQTALDEQWKRDNREWIDAHRHWVESNPLPLERYRLF